MTQQYLDTADRLRTVRKAQEHFLALWALDCLYDHARVGDKLVADVLGAPFTRDPNGSASPDDDGENSPA